MTQWYLRAKNWQLFLVTHGLPLLIFTLFFGNRSENSVPGQQALHFTLIVLALQFHFAWYWVVGTKLQATIPKDLKLQLGRFMKFYLVLFIYVFLFAAVGSTIMGSTFTKNLFPFIIPTHIFVMFCFFYCLYFVAKTIKTAELQKKVSFGDFAEEFFLIWFYPIGIWFVQHKINKIAQRLELHSETF